MPMWNRTDHGAVALNTQIEALQRARQQSWGRINRYRLRLVLRYAGDSILDVGCATGMYVDYLNANGYEAWGLDLLAYPEWTQGQERACVRGTLAYLPFADGSFDTVTAFEVLEHLPEPQRALQEIHRVSRKNLVVTVPDCEVQADLLRAGLIYAHWRDRTHCNFFTQRSLEDVLERAGFQIETVARINPILPDFPVLRSFHIPVHVAFFASRVLRRIPFRKQYKMTLLAVANRV
jgi:SAM-dependent methyltransferase